MDLIALSPWDLALAAGLVLLLALMPWRLRLGVGQRVLAAAARSALQFVLLGLVLGSCSSCKTCPGSAP